MRKNINISPLGSLRGLVCGTLFLFSSSLAAQNIDAEFDVIDMGDITFQQPSQATFKMKNRGSEFYLKDVKPFCGCTQVNFPKKNIAKGENFSITVTYDAEMLGHFQKDVALMSDQFEAPYYLTIKGNVVAYPTGAEAAEANGGAAVTMGKMLVSRDNIEFADTYQGNMIQEKVTITNLDKQPINPQVIHVPQYMSAQITPSVIQPGKQGVITFTLNANMLPRYGLTQTSVYLAQFPGDVIAKDKEIMVTAIKLPTLQLSESQRSKVPVLTLSDDAIDLGNSLKGDIVLANKGKSPLVISTIQSFCPGLNITLNKMTLNPSESTILRVKGTRKNLKDLKQQPRILLITNDPNSQKVILDVKYKL